MLGLYLSLYILAGASCHGDGQVASHLLLIESLPEGFDLDKPTFLNVRTNLSGTVRVAEASEFRIVVNISAPNLQEAYGVQAELTSHNSGLLLQVQQTQDTPAVFITLTWLGVGIGGATVLVLIITSIYAFCWYSSERSLYDLAEKKSCASSSHRSGVYRSRNSMQIGHLPPIADLPVLRDDPGAQHGDDFLKHVPERPEQEAEAIEMEELTQQKLKDLEGSSPVEIERVLLTTQEKNSIKSQFHAQSKNVHKDLLKKDKTANKPPVRRRTVNGTYSIVATSPDNTGGLSEESMESEVDTDQDMASETSRERISLVQSSSEGSEVQKPLSTFMSPSKTKLGLGFANTTASDYTLNGEDAGDLELTVMADVHKIGSASEIIRVSTPERLGYPGMGPTLPHEPARPTLTTFASPAQTAVSPPSHGKAIRFREPLDNDGKSLPQNPVVIQRGGMMPRFPAGFAAMGDIPEDPREDYDSAQSESGQSRSMYGSSEIFDATALEQTYFNLEDSDIDIPPLDAEDILSDGGLPSPLTPLSRSRTTQDDSNVQGQRTFFYSREYGFNSLSKPRPNSSIILRPDQNQPSSDSGLSSGISSDQTPTPVNSEPDSTSPRLPPPPILAGQVTQDVSAFEFPPPPKYFASPQQIGWSSSQNSPLTASAGEYVTLPNNSTKGTGKGSSRGGSSGRLGFGSNFVNLTVICVVCILSVISGVYSKMLSDNETRVDITIFAPKSFLAAQKNTIFFNHHKHTDLNIDEGFDFDAFVMQDPILTQITDLCEKKDCVEHGCDIQTGECICHKGYRMSEDSKCVDINECAEGLTECHSSAGCLNRKGSYDCVCSVDYYGDGKTCHDCNTPCHKDQYEVQPCSKSSQKICKDCTKECHKGFYKASQCTDYNNAICRVCQPPCLEGQYEFRTCSNFHDRQCTNVSLLPDVEVSDNIIMEDDRKIQESEVVIEDQPSQIVNHPQYSLNRGTSLYVDISIHNLEVAQQFIPLEVHDVNVTAMLPSILKSSSVQHFCSHPVPDYYILRYIKHEDVTYNISDEKEVAPCQTFKDFGNFPSDVLHKENSFLCTEPGPLTKLFEIPPETFQTTTFWAEKLKRCADQSHKCETCTKQCAQQMSQTNADCSIVGDNNDNGWSPRLQVCYNCCARSNCSDACYNKLHRRRCNPLKCYHGSLIEFSIFPLWNGSQNGKFYCHIHPIRRQRLLEMTYSVRSDRRSAPIHTANVVIDGGEEWEKRGEHHYKNDLLNIVIESNLGKPPDFLEGATAENSRMFSVGSYVQEGSRADVTALSGKREFIFLHPVKPFGIQINRADKNKCESQILKESLVAGDYKKPYIPNIDLHAVPFQNSSLPFIVSDPHKLPFVKISLDRGSFLKHIFPPAFLERDSLTGNMMQNTSHWTVEVMGTVKQCPGYLKVILSDPAYRHTPLYSLEVAVTCPRNFHLKFYLPTGDEPGVDRQVVASIMDAKQVHNLHLHKPAAQQEERELTISKTDESQEGDGEQDGKVMLPEGFIFSISYMVSVGGAIVLLLCLLFIGLIVQPGVPAPEPPILKCHHAMFTVIYIVFHFFYSLVATSSVFFIIIIAVNSPRVSFILQHRQQAAATTASHQLELTAMQTFLRQEIHRQNAHMDDMRSLCRLDMQVLVDDMKKMHDKLLLKTEDVFKKHHLHSLLEQHKHRSLQQLSQDLTSYREKYDTVVRTMLRQLNRDVDQSYRSIENNSWLAGARFLHGAVMNIRKNINNVETKPFLEWASLQADLKKLAVEVSFSLPVLPKLRDIEEVMESPETQQVKRSSQKTAQPSFLKTTRIFNQWYTPFSNNQSAEIGSKKQLAQETRSDQFYITFYIFLGIFIFLDITLLLHRFLKACSIGRLLLYGFPEYMDFRERKEDGNDDVFDDGGKCKCCKESTFCQAVRAFFSQLISSTFVPKAVIVVIMALLLRGILHFSESSLTVTALKQAGLYHSSEDYLDLHAKLINGRLKAHAEHINTVDFPAYQTWMSTYIQRHQFAFQIYQQQLELMKNIHLHTYCQYLQSLGLAENCIHGNQDNDTEKSIFGMILPTCQFQPVLPQFYKRSESVYRNLAERQLQVILENMQAIIFDTCQVIVVFVSVIILKELLCGVIWIFIRRSGLIRLRIIYETDHDDQGQGT